MKTPSRYIIAAATSALWLQNPMQTFKTVAFETSRIPKFPNTKAQKRNGIQS